MSYYYYQLYCFFYNQGKQEKRDKRRMFSDIPVI